MNDHDDDKAPPMKAAQAQQIEMSSPTPATKQPAPTRGLEVVTEQMMSFMQMGGPPPQLLAKINEGHIDQELKNADERDARRFRLADKQMDSYNADRGAHYDDVDKERKENTIRFRMGAVYSLVVIVLASVLFGVAIATGHMAVVVSIIERLVSIAGAIAVGAVVKDPVKRFFTPQDRRRLPAAGQADDERDE